MYAQNYDYHGRYDGYYRNYDYYERRGNYDDGLIFNPKLNIPEFDGRMDAGEFLDWLNMVEHVFMYYDPPQREKSEVGGYQAVQECFHLVEKLEETM